MSFLLEYDTGTEHLAGPGGQAGRLPGAGRGAGLARADLPGPQLFCFGSPRREQGARRALAATRQAADLRIATASIDPRLTSPRPGRYGCRWLNHAGRQARLIDLDDAIPDPWRQYREDRARERRRAAERERALRPDDEDDEPAALADGEEFR